MYPKVPLQNPLLFQILNDALDPGVERLLYGVLCLADRHGILELSFQLRNPIFELLVAIFKGLVRALKRLYLLFEPLNPRAVHIGLFQDRLNIVG